MLDGKYRVYCQVGDLEESRALLTQIRHQIHQNPELSFKEAATSALVAARLEEWGYEVTRNVGGHGVVGRLKAGDGTRSVSLRADMDALPIMEATGAAHASRNPGVMHACGHDGHTTMLLGAARHLAKTRNFSGTVNLVFQPAEEAGMNGGAEKMIADGLFDRFPCDAIFGMHNSPGYPAGTFMFNAGPSMSASDTVNITIRGRGGHASRPHLTVDPILIAGSLVMALQSVVSRNVDPRQAAVVTIGTLHAGTVRNVIPQSAEMSLSVRSFDNEVRDRLEQRITDLVTAHVEGYGGSVELEYIRGYPVLINSASETEFARKVAEDLVGPERTVFPYGSVTGSEDFAYFLQHRPGSFVRIGNGDTAMVHSANYDFNDANLTVGAAYWARLVETYLAR
jgi:hippurate hydrolase